jgi:pimeloyl-ACP methyl ester carboxylesterase
MPENTRQVATRHGEIQLYDQGVGRTIVFLHCGEGLEASLPCLTRIATRNRVVAAAHPGFGQSDLPNQFCQIADLAYFYLDFLQALGLRDVVLAGVSFGGWIAAEIALRSTARLSGLILADALGMRTTSVETHVEIKDVFTLPQEDIDRMSFVAPAKWRRSYETLSDSELFALARNREALALYGWSPYMHNPILRRWLHRIDVPTLVLWGEHDGIVSVDYGRAYASAIEGARFQVIHGAAHHPQIEQPERFADFVEDFIAVRAKRDLVDKTS